MPISSDVLFAFGKAELTETARRQKAALADRLTDVEGVVVIEGHTDAVEKEPARLVPGVRTRTVGYGEARPVAPDTRTARTIRRDGAKNPR